MFIIDHYLAKIWTKVCSLLFGTPYIQHVALQSRAGAAKQTVWGHRVLKRATE